MQVSHVKDHVTHAVIGGGETIDFGISNSAEFFNILSSTLYKDQILAVVREVLCNAWDAHIEAGVQHVPVAITLDGEKFTIKDFGKGIHRDDMGLIYGIYGNSTKKNDGKQTGGFGLGCKAPFAYTDHFEVISCHDGVKTIYNLSKSSAQALGKPGIVPIASFPTTDTGLQVSIRVKNGTDLTRFDRLIRRIVSNGDMHMTLNGKKLEQLGFDTTKSNYLILDDIGICQDKQARVMVRYGNVIYPVDESNEIRHAYQRITLHLNLLGNNRHNMQYNIIFQAPPHSISVTPSRESLSMQEHTVATLNKLFNDFLALLDGNFQEECNNFAKEVVKVAVDAAQVSPLLRRESKLPLGAHNNPAPAVIRDLETMASCYMQANYPGTVEFRKRDIKHRLETMVAGGLLERGIVQTYLNELKNVKQLTSAPNSWLQRRVLAPLLVKLTAAGLDRKCLYAYDGDDHNTPKRVLSTSSFLIPTDRVAPKHLFQCLPYLRNIVVVSTSQRDIALRTHRHAVFKELGNYDGFLFYHAGMKKKDKEDSLAFFKAQGMTVVDLTVKTEEDMARAATRAVVPRKPPRTGLPKLSAIQDPGSKGIDVRLSKLDNVALIANPEFVIPVSIRKNEPADTLDDWGSSASRCIVTLFGDVGGIVHNSTVASKYYGKGAKHFEVYLEEKVYHEMLTNPRIQEYWAFEPERTMDRFVRGYCYGSAQRAFQKFVRLIYGNKNLCAEFGLVNNLTEEDKMYIELWHKMGTWHTFSSRNAFAAVNAYLKKIELDPANEALIKKIKDNPLVNIIEVDALKTLFHIKRNKPHELLNAEKALVTLINN